MIIKKKGLGPPKSFRAKCFLVINILSFGYLTYVSHLYSTHCFIVILHFQENLLREAVFLFWPLVKSGEFLLLSDNNNVMVLVLLNYKFCVNSLSKNLTLYNSQYFSFIEDCNSFLYKKVQLLVVSLFFSWDLKQMKTFDLTRGRQCAHLIFIFLPPSFLPFSSTI